jgi:hypothetical protein
MPHLSGRAASACDVTVVACSTARRQFTKRRQIEQFAHAVFPTTYTELLAVTGGEAADVA